MWVVEPGPALTGWEAGMSLGQEAHTHTLHSHTHTHTSTPRDSLESNLTPFSPPAGVSNLIQQVCRLNKGLRLLNLSKTSLTAKGSDLRSHIPANIRI